MTADIRTAAQREAERLRVTSSGRKYGMAKLYKVAFVDGAVWLASRLTRENIAEVLWSFPINVITLAELNTLADAGERDLPEVRDYLYAQADAVLALMAGLAECENDG